MSRGRLPQDIGTAFEEWMADKLSGEVVPGSGNGKFAKGDVRGEPVLLLCKATKYNSFSVTDTMLAEARLVGNRMGARPGMAVECDGRVYVVQELEDWLEYKETEEGFERTKADEKKRIALVPRRAVRSLEPEWVDDDDSYDPMGG